MSYSLATIPAWEQKGKYYRFLIKDLPEWKENPNDYFLKLNEKLPDFFNENIRYDCSIDNIEDFIDVYQKSKFWDLDEFPIEMYLYGYYNKTEVLEYLNSFIHNKNSITIKMKHNGITIFESFENFDFLVENQANIVEYLNLYFQGKNVDNEIQKIFFSNQTFNEQKHEINSDEFEFLITKIGLFNSQYNKFLVEEITYNTYFLKNKSEVLKFVKDQKLKDKLIKTVEIEISTYFSEKSKIIEEDYKEYNYLICLNIDKQNIKAIVLTASTDINTIQDQFNKEKFETFINCLSENVEYTEKNNWIENIFTLKKNKIIFFDNSYSENNLCDKKILDLGINITDFNRYQLCNSLKFLGSEIQKYLITSGILQDIENIKKKQYIIWE